MKRTRTKSWCIAMLLLLPPCAALGKSPQIDVVRETSVAGLWLMGQSLCAGGDSLPIVTPTDPGWGNYIFKRGVHTWYEADHGSTPEQRPDSEFAFVPLVATEGRGGLGETIANGLADHLKARIIRLNPARAKTGAPHFLVAYAGQGGRGIEELSAADESTDPRTPANRQNGGGYYKTSLDDARRATRQAEAQGKNFKIVALIWMQGERNAGPRGGIEPSRWKAEIPRPAGQEWYRDRLIAYRKQWSDDLRAITGQAGEIPMFTYQTLGAAGEAQLMAADKDPHIYMVGPHYMVPSALNSRRAGRYGALIHLTADGSRWYGEQVGKVVGRVFEGEDWQPVRPRKAWIDPSRTSVLLEFDVPRPPLVIDESFFPRQQGEMSGGFSSLGGFRIRNGAEAGLAMTAVELESPTRVRIRLASTLPRGTEYTVSYGLRSAGTIGAIAGIRRGPVIGGQPTTELVLAGGFPERLKPLLAEGAFTVRAAEGNADAEATIRFVHDAKGSTVLRFENRERSDNADFAVGQTLIALRPFVYGNLRDSDPEPAVYHFGDAAYGRRAGQPYPLWNWCVLFEGLPISEM